MKKVKQLSVFVQNIPGRLAQITTDLAKAKINLRAISMADTTDFGILRLIVDNPEGGEKKLKDMEYTVSVTEVLAVGFDDTPGALANVLRVLAANGIGIEYMHAFVCNAESQACVIMKPTDMDKAIDVIDGDDHARLFSDDEIYTY